jgi:hypothetical protein
VGDPTVELELGYDLLGSRLVRIGDAAVGYDDEQRPIRVGQVALRYDAATARLDTAGTRRVGYEPGGNRMRSVGEWELSYDRLGSRLRRLGPYELRHDLFGNRVRTVGPMTISYDLLRNRAAFVSVPGDELTDDLMLVLFLVLWIQQRRQAKARP